MSSDQGQKDSGFSIRDCIPEGEPVTVERLIELSTGEGKCARVAKGMLDALVGKENAEKLRDAYNTRDADRA